VQLELPSLADILLLANEVLTDNPINSINKRFFSGDNFLKISDLMITIDIMVGDYAN